MNLTVNQLMTNFVTATLNEFWIAKYMAKTTEMTGNWYNKIRLSNRIKTIMKKENF